ncbi:amidohydrolase family protein [Sphingomonas sp.]|uniref:metal-dependent hydrolase family protein n=1 Tax=Sphingomonas sp. TaxID=28214 RepID=UPI002CD91CC2|nr:amidohydrolase family protein [Sphingomonas sp.]HWK35080.1 amidohydrolase family protein [Sphingomonas sp.]
MIAAAAGVLACAGLPAAAQSQVSYIQAGRLLDRPGQAPRGPATIIVRDGKVAEVRDGLVAPEAGATLVDLRDRFVMPGLIDLHVHVYADGDPLRQRLDATTRDDGDALILAAAKGRRNLLAGFTTIRDLGGDPRGIRALRDAIERGDIAGPTIVNAGTMISVTGGHGDGRNGLAEDFADAVHAHQINVCDGPDDCRRAVRAQIGLGALVIKFAATGGVLSNVAGGLGRQMTPEEMKAIVDTAHSFGRRVAVHSHAAEGTAAAIEAGADTIEHASYLDDATIALFKRHGTWLVPTEIAPVAAVASARAGALPASVIPKAEAAVKALHESHRRAFAAGVKFAFGTDTGVSRHGENATEFAYLVDLGMTPMQAIRSATIDAADALDRKGEIGSLEPGKWADVIAVRGDPLGDVRLLEKTDFVMRHGVVHKANGEATGFVGR